MIAWRRPFERVIEQRSGAWIAVGLLAGFALALAMSARTRLGRRLPPWDGERARSSAVAGERES